MSDYGSHSQECIGVWVAFYPDDGYEVFRTEVDALRYALARSMQVEFRPFQSGDRQR